MGYSYFCGDPPAPLLPFATAPCSFRSGAVWRSKCTTDCPRPTLHEHPRTPRRRPGLEAAVGHPAHARRFRREVVFVLGGTAPPIVQALGNLAGPVRGALIRLFALRGVSQAVAQPAPEIAPAVDLPAAPAAIQAPEPPPAAAEHGGRVDERHELVDVNRHTLTIRALVVQAHAVVLCDQPDRSRLLAPARPRQRRVAANLEQASPT